MCRNAAVPPSLRSIAVGSALLFQSMVALRYPQRPRLRAACLNCSTSASVRYSRGLLLAFFCRFGGACRLTTVPISVFRAGSLMSGSIAGNHQYRSRTVPFLAFFGTVSDRGDEIDIPGCSASHTMENSFEYGQDSETVTKG